MTNAPEKIESHVPLVQKELKPAPLKPQPRIDDYSYALGFSKGFEAADSAIVAWPFGICAFLVIIFCFAVLASHLSALHNMMSRLQSGLLEKLKESDNAANFKGLLMGLMLTFCLVGCAGKGGDQIPAPVPPETANAPAPADGTHGKDTFTPYDASYHEDSNGQYLAVNVPQDDSSGPHHGEPEALVDLLEMKGTDSREKTAVQLMRPSAIRDAAQLVTFQTAIAWRYKQLLAATEAHSTIMDAAFNFSPLLMTQGQALIMPPMLTRAGASMRIEKADSATAAESTYELLEPARYIATAPTWREFLMADDFPKPEKPHPAVLPKNSEERAIWRSAVREAWAQGVAEADQLYADNVSRMVRQYRGIMLYHLLTAQHLLSRVTTASSDMGMHTSRNGNKLNIGQKVYRITAPSAFRTAQKARKR